MSKKIEKIVEGIAKPIVELSNLEYVDCEYLLEGKERQLIIYIDSENGVTLDDCEKISLKVEAVLDGLDPIEESYCLCVSSPGLDRPLKTERDFNKNIGNEVDIHLYRSIDKVKDFKGILTEFGEGKVKIKTKGKEISFDIKDVAAIKLHIDF